MSDRVILVHGLWLHGPSMTWLRHRLEDAGFRTHDFAYPSMSGAVEPTAARLREHLRDQTGTVHVVGHSLGGVLALAACAGATDLPPGRIVCLASPLAGSASARQMARFGGGWLLGGNRELLVHGVQRWNGPRQVGMIAGTLGFGLGLVLGGVVGCNDGTVALTETVVPGLTDQCIVKASHTGILFSRAAAAQTIAFLRHGHFKPA